MEPVKKRRGRPPQLAEDAPALTMSTIKWYLLRLLIQGHSPEACAHAFKAVFGEVVMTDAIRAWRATAFTEEDELRGEK
jgi:hypothetical protein